MGNNQALADFIRVFRKNKIAMIGLVITSILILSALFAPLVAPFSPIAQSLPDRLMPPAWAEGGQMAHLLGTDDFGRDLFSRIIYGSQISLRIGVISVSISLVFGLTLGTLAGFYGGRVDALIMRTVDIMLALPAILLAIVIVAMLGPSLNNAMIAIGVVGIPAFARLIRGSVLQEKQKEYVTASRINGASNMNLMFKVILPNCLSPVIVQATMGFASAVLEAAGLSFLGLGAQPPTPEWGAMLSDGLEYITTAPWVITYPGLAILLTVLGFNLIGDGLMDALDPKRKGKG